MQVTRKRLLAATLAPALIMGLAISELPFASGHDRALAAVNLGCTVGLSISPSSSGTFSTPGKPTIVTLSVASGLDAGKEIFLAIYDAAGHSASLIPLDSATVNGGGGYSGRAQLPASGVAGGNDTIVVADLGPKCASAPFTITPLVNVIPSQGIAFNFNGYGFHAGATISVTFTDHAGTPFSLTGTTSNSLGSAGGLSISIPGNAAIGVGSLVFDDGQGGRSSAIPFTFTGIPPTPTPCPLCPTDTPVPTNTFGPTSTVGSATSTPLPLATNTPPPGATSTPVPFGTNTALPTFTQIPFTSPSPTWTPPPGSTSTWTPQPTSTNTPLANIVFPSPTRTPSFGFPSPTPSPTSAVSRCKRRGTLEDGDFTNGLVCWHTNLSYAVAIQPVSKSSSVKAAHVTAQGNTVVLSQAFIGGSGTKSVTFYFQNLAKPAMAQLTENGRVLVGRRLLPTKAGTFIFAALPFPSMVKATDEITVAFTAQKGSLLVHDVALSKWPAGVPPTPAPKAKPKH